MTQTAAPAPITPERLLHRLDLRVIKRLDGLFQGDFRTLFYGSGIDFSDLRGYQPHDDIRHIDWNVTARMDAPFVRQYSEDRELTAWLILDRSPSMTFGVGERTKAMAVTEFVTTLARLLTRSGNRVGAALFQQGIEQILEPRSGRNQVLRVAHEMIRPHQPTTGRTDLGAALASAARSIRQRSLVFVVSDFITSPGWERSLATLAQRHEVIAVRILDADESRIVDAGVVVFEDLESGEQLTVDTSDPAFRERFIAAAEARDAAIRDAATRAGVDLHHVSTNEDLVGALVRLSQRRRQMSR